MQKTTQKVGIITKRRWSLSDLDLCWSTEPVQYLGYFISADLYYATKLSWENKLTKLQKLLDNWRSRNLTIFGRIIVVKSLALSIIVHLMMVDTIPPKCLQKLNKLVFNFIWKSKIDKVKRSILTQDYSQGGLRMVNTEKQILSFRLRWLGRLLDDSKGPWKDMCNYWFDLLGGVNLLLNCNYDHKLFDVQKSQLPDFYLEILQAWNYVKGFTCSEIILYKIHFIIGK